jgi:hypothetical protein
MFFFSSRGKKLPEYGKENMKVTKITASSLYRLVVAGVITPEEARKILKDSGILK